MEPWDVSLDCLHQAHDKCGLGAFCRNEHDGENPGGHWVDCECRCHG